MSKNRERNASVKPAGASTDPSRQDPLNQVRTILFGEQADEVDSRLQDMERRIAGQGEELRRSYDAKLEELEEHFGHELQRVVVLIDKEHKARLSAFAEKSREVQASTKALEKRLGTMENSRISGERELRKQLRDQSKTLLGDLKDQSQQLTQLIEGHVAAFTEAKLDRDAFSKILVDAAERVSMREDRSLTS